MIRLPFDSRPVQVKTIQWAFSPASSPSRQICCSEIRALNEDKEPFSHSNSSEHLSPWEKQMNVFLFESQRMCFYWFISKLWFGMWKQHVWESESNICTLSPAAKGSVSQGGGKTLHRRIWFQIQWVHTGQIFIVFHFSSISTNPVTPEEPPKYGNMCTLGCIKMA